MPLLIDASLFLAALLILIASGSLLVKSLVVIGKFLRLSDFVTGFIIMAVATSMPELFIALSSGFNKTPTLSLGDAMGSSFVELTLILGISLLLARKIRIKHQIVKKNAIYMMAIGSAPVFLLANRTLSRLDGFILLALFVAYFWWVIRNQQTQFNSKENSVNRVKAAKNMLIFIAGLFALLLSAHYVVRTGTRIALDLGTPLLTVGLVALGLGTALPELVFGIRSVLKGKKEMSLGDTIGSVVVNSTLVLGVLAIIQPFTIQDYALFSISSIFFLGAISINSLFFILRNELNWMHGLIQLLLYILFIGTQVRIA
ncbi:sodium:calcium antiporter [Candidatus Woesearchaeota archaeon]|nr:sodium:calcium antiporter [Candidatus Woesearchaeota archaeon]